MNNKAKKRGKVEELKMKLTRFGEAFDGDHCSTRQDGWERGYDGSTVSLCLHDLYSEYTDFI